MILKNYITSFVFIMTLLFGASDALAQSFQGQPYAEFSIIEGPALQLNIGGTVSLGSYPITSLQVKTAILEDQVSNLTTYSGPFSSAYVDFSSAGTFFDVVTGGFVPGEDYYVIYSLQSNDPAVSFTPVNTGVSLTAPMFAGNDDSEDCTPANPCDDASSDEEDCTPSNPCDGETVGNGASWPQAVFTNPLAVDNLNSFVAGLLSALLKIGIPIMVVFLVYSGLRLVMARGNEKELESAKKNILWVIIGIAILLGAWTIVKILKGTFDQIDIAFIINRVNHYIS